MTAAKGDGDTIIGGEQITFTATPEDGYQVADWIVNDVPQNSNSRRLTVTVKGDTRVSVQMVADTHKVTFFSSPEDGGKVTADNGNETGTALVELARPSPSSPRPNNISTWSAGWWMTSRSTARWVSRWCCGHEEHDRGGRV